MPGPEACGIAQGAVMHFWSRNPSSSGGTAFSFFFFGRLAVSHMGICEIDIQALDVHGYQCLLSILKL